MSFDDLIQLSKNNVRTQESIQACAERMKVAALEQAETAKSQTPTNEWYERSYDI